jgi:hypothetical protein
MKGNSVISLIAPTTGTYAKMLLIQATSATEGNVSKINGANFDGAIYFSEGNLELPRKLVSGDQMRDDRRLSSRLRRHTDIQNNTTGRTANSSVSGKVVRLVA